MAYRERLDKKFEDFKRAFEKLSQLKNLALDREILFELSAKRLEYTFEILWKLIKLILEAQGVLCYSPLDCFKNLYQSGAIDENLYRELVKLTRVRNTIVHIYDFSTAEEVYSYVVEELVPSLDKMRGILEKEINEIV